MWLNSIIIIFIKGFYYQRESIKIKTVLEIYIRDTEMNFLNLNGVNNKVDGITGQCVDCFVCMSTNVLETQSRRGLNTEKKAQIRWA